MKSLMQGVQKMNKQSGLGLIEILVTIVILSIGFLAAARMQVEGMRFSQSAYHQSQAYFLANDMINRMRTNVEGVDAGHYDGLTTSAGNNNPDCPNRACTVKEIAEQDVFEWGGYFHSRDGAANFIPALPSGPGVDAFATVKRVNADEYAVELTWAETIGKETKPQKLEVTFVLGQFEV